MSRPRDTQRQKLYDAERIAFGVSTEEMTLAECQRLVNKVLDSKVIQRNYPRAKRPVTVVDGRGRRRAGYKPDRWHGDRITMPRWTRCRSMVLHEVAHHLAFSRAEAPHGWRFCATYLDLARIYMGRGAEEKLKAQMKAKGVRFRAKRTRTMTDEQRKAAAARMRALHAARQS